MLLLEADPDFASRSRRVVAASLICAQRDEVSHKAFAAVVLGKISYRNDSECAVRYTRLVDIPGGEV